MSTVNTVCPHCLRAAALAVIGKHAVKKSPNMFDLFCLCPSCGRSCLANIVAASRKDFSLDNMPDEIWQSDVLTVDIHPKPRTPTAPKYVPERVADLFIQGEGALIAVSRDGGRGVGLDAAAMAFRKTLEVSLKLRWPEMGGTLASRIDQLAARHEITPGLQEWAHAIRLDGNFATHDIEPVEASAAKAIRDFTELFLLYVFTLPVMLEQRKDLP